MLKKILGVVLALALVAVSVPAWASPLIDSHDQTNTQINAPIIAPSQAQGQQQGQQQGQGQGQAQSADNKGVKQEVKFEAPTIPGLAVAPGLAAAGTGVCLGSFSVGLSGPMAGVAFGKTVVDKGCERRSNSVILYQRGHFEAADYLLRLDPEVQDALDYQNKTGKHAPKAVAIQQPNAQVTTLGEPTIPQAMAVTQERQVTGVQSN